MTLSLAPDLLYIVLSATVLQFMNWQQPEHGRTMQFTILSFAYAVYAVIMGRFPLDGITLAAGIISGWVILSLAWTTSRRAPFEALTWLSYFILFTACRSIPPTLTVLAVFVPGVLFSIRQIIGTFFDTRRNGTWEMYVFGNPSHTGIYLLLCLHAGLWLTCNLSPYIFLALIPISLALVITYCRAALIAALVSLSAVLVMTYGWYAVIALGILSVPLIVKVLTMDDVRAYYKEEAGRKREFQALKWETVKTRVLLCAEAVYLARHRILFGWGLDMYRKMLPFILPAMRAGKRTGKLYAGGIAKGISHRAHNDHLEIIVELGIVGYAMFAWMFGQFTPTPLFIGVLLAMSINALFFFPFRETHIAAPFWAIAGACSVFPASPVGMPIVLKIALIAGCIVALRECYRKLMGLVWYDRSMNAKEIEKKQACIVNAVNLDEYNGRYLNEAAAVFPEGSILHHDYSARAMHHYDGDNQMWGVWEQYARSIVAINHLGAAKIALNRIIEINPEFIPALQLNAEIDSYLASLQQQQRRQ